MYNMSCDSWGCDRNCTNDEIYYKFIPKYILDDDNKIILNDCNSHFYCNQCMTYIIKDNKNKFFNGKKRIFAYYEKDDYGFLENEKCDFCDKMKKKVKVMSSMFKTMCEYNGIRNNFVILNLMCNGCTKKYPKQIFKEIKN